MTAIGVVPAGHPYEGFQSYGLRRPGPGSPRGRDASGNQQIRCVATYQFDGLRQKPEFKAKNKQIQHF